jgi:hypothetical protein
VSNSASLVIGELGVCLGLRDGDESGSIHYEIWTDQVGGCAGGYPFCPGTKIGGDSDPFTVDALATMQSSPNGACGDRITATSSPLDGRRTATTSSNFWIVGVNDSPGGILTGQVRWGASAFGIVDTHADTGSIRGKTWSTT